MILTIYESYDRYVSRYIGTYHPTLDGYLAHPPPRFDEKGKAASICMNPMQVHGMAIIAEHPSITMKEFATQLHISSPSATSFVDRLVKGQWVERVPNPDNRKLVHLRLSSSGRAALASAMKEHSAVMHDLFSLLSSEDQSQLERVLIHLKEALAQNIASQ